MTAEVSKLIDARLLEYERLDAARDEAEKAGIESKLQRIRAQQAELERQSAIISEELGRAIDEAEALQKLPG